MKKRMKCIDRSKMEEPKEIRFIYPDYQEKFRIPDGDQILVTYPTGDPCL